MIININYSLSVNGYFFTKIGDGDWGFGDWGLGIGPNPQSPIPNPQSPIPNPHIIIYTFILNNCFRRIKLIN